MLKWQKTMSRTDAQQETLGSKLRFLRLTKEDLDIEEWQTWFRNEFFRDLEWRSDKSHRGDAIEVAEAVIEVTIFGHSLGPQTMKVDHSPLRGKNHRAPLTHLHLSNAVLDYLEEHDTEASTVSLYCDASRGLRLDIK